LTSAGHLRRRIVVMRSAGTSLTRVSTACKFYRRLSSAGSSQTSIRGTKLALPPPTTRGLRVAPWTRPTHKANLRFTSWTAPV
jgi:hypothetical protein